MTDPKQAIAGAPSEAGASDRADEATDGRDLHEGTSSRAALYAEARRRKLPGRSTMTKAELQRVLTG